jgi:membrane protein DedA with SNARE-associated domain
VGGVFWASLFGFGSYFLGDNFTRVAGPVPFLIFVAAVVAISGAIYFFRTHEKKIEPRAEEMLSGWWPCSILHKSK